MNTFNQRRSRSGTFAPNDYTPKTGAEREAFRLAEAELMRKNQARPMPTTYQVLVDVKAERVKAEIQHNMRQALSCFSVGNLKGARIFNDEILRLEARR